VVFRFLFEFASSCVGYLPARGIQLRTSACLEKTLPNGDLQPVRGLTGGSAYPS
jgi:hypothetical protein